MRRTWPVGNPLRKQVSPCGVWSRAGKPSNNSWESAWTVWIHSLWHRCCRRSLRPLEKITPSAGLQQPRRDLWCRAGRVDGNGGAGGQVCARMARTGRPHRRRLLPGLSGGRARDPQVRRQLQHRPVIGQPLLALITAKAVPCD